MLECRMFTSNNWVELEHSYHFCNKQSNLQVWNLCISNDCYRLQCVILALDRYWTLPLISYSIVILHVLWVIILLHSALLLLCIHTIKITGIFNHGESASILNKLITPSLPCPNPSCPAMHFYQRKKLQHYLPYLHDQFDAWYMWQVIIRDITFLNLMI